jgi:PAS domain S-box-containing protein
MSIDDEEDRLLRSVTLQNANSILLARQRAEQQLIEAKESLERRSTELAHSLAMMRATLESTTDAVLVTDGTGKVTDFNQNYAEIWHLSSEAMQARDHWHLLQSCSLHFADPQKFLGRVREIYASAPPETFETLHLIDGRIIERASMIQFVDGKNVGRVWNFRDITERRRATEALRDETRVLELLNEAGRVIGSTLDLKTLLQAVTDLATKLSGASFGAFFYNTTDEKGDAFLLYTLSGAPREAFEKFGQPRATPLFGPTFRGEAPIRIDDVLLDERYGKMAPHFGMPAGHLSVRSYLAVPVISRSNLVIGGLFFGHSRPGVFNDRTERLIAGLAAQAAVAVDNARLYEDLQNAAKERERLLEAERAARAEAERISLMKDEFLATISHELRTPLTAILGWSQLIQTGNVSAEDLALGVETIARNARAQTQLIEDLLDMSRIIAGKVRLDVQRTDPASVVDAAIASIRPSTEAKGIRLRTILDPQAGPVSGDPGRLQQVVWNLLSNAVKFTPKGGSIDVVLERINSHVEITVSDSGIGIRPEFLPHAFERFRQADSSTTRNFGGLGLGLSIVKQLVELHGGFVRVASEGEGRGATFTVGLPVAPIRDVSERDHPTTSKLPWLDCETLNLGGVKVLIVDDEPDSRELIRRALAQCDVDVVVASSADEGLSLLQSEKPEILISDIGMPECDGYQFIRRVRELALGEGGQTPAIALTAFARSEDRTRAMLAGYQVHVAKPIEARELLATVASLVNRAKTR